jgi:hypothetical protein
MENFTRAVLRKRVTRLAVLRDGQRPSQFRFPNGPKTLQAVLSKLPEGRGFTKTYQHIFGCLNIGTV